MAENKRWLRKSKAVFDGLAAIVIRNKWLSLAILVMLASTTAAILTIVYNNDRDVARLAAVNSSGYNIVERLDPSVCRKSATFTDIDSALADPDSVCLLNISFKDNVYSLPQSISRLKNLRELRARGIQAKELPSSIGSLKNLELIDVMDSDLTKLPPEIGKLKNLRFLDVGGTAITSLPPEVGQLSALVFLDTMDTPLVALPAELSHLKNLRDLDIDETPIRDLGPIAGLENLERLILDYTYQPDITPILGLNKLIVLSLVSCQFERLPEGLGSLESLIKLNLSQNNISRLPDLSGLRNLKQLDVSGNPLTISDKQRLKESLTRTVINGL